MKVLLVEPMKLPTVLKIDGKLQSMQELVGGSIQAIYPFDDSVAVICNEEGKFLKMPLNRALYDEEGEIYDVIAGTFLICGAPSDSEKFTSLTDNQIKHYAQLYKSPQIFVSLNGQIQAIPLAD